MATIETIYRARIDYDYNQRDMDTDNTRELEDWEASCSDSPMPQPRWLFEEIEVAIHETMKKYPDTECNDNQGGPAWNAYLILTSPLYTQIADCVEELEMVIRSFPHTKVMEES